MNAWRLVLRSLFFHWRIHGAVILGVAAATAVLTGALLVGDSVRGSLRHLTLDRLGKIDELLIVDRFFRSELARELAQQPGFQEHYSAAVPAIVLPSATAERASDAGRQRAAGVLVIGSGADFWQLGADGVAPPKIPGDGQIVLNATLAKELGASVGDQLVLRLAKVSQIPADSPLGRKTDRTSSLAELTLIDILPAEGLGRFSLQSTQTSPRIAYVATALLQDALEVPGKVNAIFVSGKNPKQVPSPAASAALAAALHPTLADYGLTLKHVRQTFAPLGASAPADAQAADAQAASTPDVIFDYYSLSSDRMMLDPATERAALQAFAGLKPEPLLTYLANSIAKIPTAAELADKANPPPKPIPYSTITAIDPAPGGPLIDEAGKLIAPLAEDEIVLNRWAADDQRAKVGDRIRIRYFEPETTHGNEQEAAAEFRVKAIVPLTKPKSPFTRRGPAQFAERPTTANDPDLTPEVKGITDQASIADWDAPFPFDYGKIRDPQDDDYWEDYRTTPKAFVALATGEKLWGSRFGKATSIRVPAAPGVSEDMLRERFLKQLAQDDERLGFNFLPLKRQGLAASAGTTPFDVLFLLLSMFIIAAALMLVWLLFSLGVEQRASEVGLLLALGWTRRKASWVLLLEGACVAAIGAAIGVAGGVGYAWLMLAGLRSWWIGAITTPFLHLYITPLSLLVGFASGVLVSLLTIYFGVRGLRKSSARQLLAGNVADLLAPPTAKAKPSALRRMWSWLGVWFPPLLFVAAVGLAVLATRLAGDAQAGAFLGAGAAILLALLLLVARWLKRQTQGASAIAGTTHGAGNAQPARSLLDLARRNAGRNVGRSVTTIALMASASFLILAVSSFRIAPSERGVGGFDLLATSSQSIIDDLQSPAGRKALLADKAAVLAGATVFSFRVKAGDDASCQNMYKPSQPKVLGVPGSLVKYFDDPRNTPFGWAGSAATTPAERANPWQVLAQPPMPAGAIPVVLDKNTAMYSLQLYGGIGEEFAVTYEGEPPVTFRVVGLLDSSVLQGSLLVSEANFKRLFPTISGYREFLIRSPAGQSAAVAAVLEDKLGDEGFDAVSSYERLGELLAVQNTYISTFQSLGALGLLLGTFGLAAVQLRSVFERRKELALLRAVGFRRVRLGKMVLLENLLLLLGGLLTGTLAALATVLPHMLAGGARVPLAELLGTLAIVLVVGMATGLLAVRATLKAPLLAALRGE